MSRTWRLGTRGSELAQTQSGHVAEALRAVSGDAVELVIIRTRGDQITDRPLAEIGGKGLFTKELEDAMLAGTIDLAVHSMKDMPTEGPPGLVIADPPPREDARDVLVGGTLDDLPEGAVVGTGSARRGLQLRALRPDLEVRGIRGNIDTRIHKQRSGDYDVVVLAAAGMHRTGRQDLIDAYLDVGASVPAPGQGLLALQCREDDLELRALLARLACPDATDVCALERAFMAALGGGCSVPAGCHARADGDTLHVEAFLGRADGAWVGETVTVVRREAARAGTLLARHLVGRLDAQPARSPEEGPARRGTLRAGPSDGA